MLGGVTAAVFLGDGDLLTTGDSDFLEMVAGGVFPPLDPAGEQRGVILR